MPTVSASCAPMDHGQQPPVVRLHQMEIMFQIMGAALVWRPMEDTFPIQDQWFCAPMVITIPAKAANYFLVVVLSERSR